MFILMLMRLCLCASENSIRQISGFVLLVFLLMLMLMSRVFSLMLMLCLCASENQPLGDGVSYTLIKVPITPKFLGGRIKSLLH